MQLKSFLNLTLKKVVYTVLGEVENRSKNFKTLQLSEAKRKDRKILSGKLCL